MKQKTTRPTHQKQNGAAPSLIGSGRYRDVYLLEETTCIKVPKKHRTKDYGLFSIHYPMGFYTWFKFDIKDFNQYEFDNYKRYFETAGNGTRRFFARLLGIKNGMMFMGIIRDYDWSVSRPLCDSGVVESVDFWKGMLEIHKFLDANDIPFMHLTPANIVVKRSTSNVAVPVIVDYKHVGQNLLPFQPWLKLSWFRKLKMRRVFKRFIMNHAPKEQREFLVSSLL